MGDAPESAARPHGIMGTSILLLMFLEDATVAIDRIMRRRVPIEFQEKAIGEVLARLERQLAPERERLSPPTSFSELPCSFESD